MEQLSFDDLIPPQSMPSVTSRIFRGRAPALFVEAGQRFGAGTVIDADVRHSCPSKENIRAARLICDCGNEYVSGLQGLLCGKSKSCGCLKGHFIDRTGQRYGKLVAIRRVGTGPHGNALWLCKCDCGAEVSVNANALQSSSIRSCGCLIKRPKDGYLRGQATRNLVYRGYREGAYKRNFTWELADEDFDGITSRNCFYCDLPPSTVRKARGARGKYGHSGEFIYNGIDRIDSKLGYTLDNVVTCCEVCNRAKSDMSFDEFLSYLDRIAIARSRRGQQSFAV